MEKSQNIHIGHCSHPHGIRGEFLFVFYNSDSRFIQKNSEIFIQSKDSQSTSQKIKVLNIRYGNKIIVELEGVVTRNQVEAMIPFDIFYPKAKLPKLLENEFYLHDLIGCKVINHKTKLEVGTVVSFYENGAQTILQVKVEREKIDILFINNFVPVVDIENKTIEVNLPEIIE